MEEKVILQLLEGYLVHARRELMRFAFEDAIVREALWFVVREGSVVVRRLGAGEPLAPDLRLRLDAVLATVDRLAPMVAARLDQSESVPWKRL